MNKVCDICGKKEVRGYNRPNSLHATKKRIFPNLQKRNNQTLCTKCIRTIDKI